MIPSTQDIPPQIKHQTTYFLTPGLCVAVKERKTWLLTLNQKYYSEINKCKTNLLKRGDISLIVKSFEANLINSLMINAMEVKSN